MESRRNRELVDAITEAISEATRVEERVRIEIDNEDFSGDDRNKLRVSSRRLESQIEDLDRPRGDLLRLVRHDHAEQTRKLENLVATTEEALAVIDNADRSRSSSVSSGSDSDSDDDFYRPAWGSRGHYSRFVPRGATRTSGGKKRTKRKATKRRPQKKRKTKKSHRKKRVTRRR